MARWLLTAAVALVVLLVACREEPEEPAAGTFETLIGFVPRAYEHGLALGDMAAWRDLAGIEAPTTVEDEEADLEAQARAAGVFGVTAWQGLGANAWFLGMESSPVSDVSARATRAFGFGQRDAVAFATSQHFVMPFPWGVVLGTFQEEDILSSLRRCAGCATLHTTEVGEVPAIPVYWWGDDGGGGQDDERSNELPLFDDLGRGGTMAFFDGRIVRSVGLEPMEALLEGPMLNADPMWIQLARLYDDAGALYLHSATAGLAESQAAELAAQLGVALDETEAPLPELDEYRLLTLGGGYEDGSTFTLMTLVFDDPEVAAANVEAVRARLEAVPAEADFGGEPWDDVEVTDVVADGALIVVRLRNAALGGLHLLAMETVLPGLPIGP